MLSRLPIVALRTFPSTLGTTVNDHRFQSAVVDQPTRSW